MGGPEFWIVGRPNGAGKSTLCCARDFRDRLDGVRFFNPDDLTLRLLRRLGYASFAGVPADVLRKTNLQAADEIAGLLASAVEAGEFVGVETILSTDKYRPLVRRVREQGGRFYLIYVSLASPALSLQRVRRRVSQGGHDVPPEKLADRWQRSLEHFPWFAGQADDFWVFDNSDSGRDAPLLLAHGWKSPVGQSLADLPHPGFASPMMAVLHQLPLQVIGHGGQ